MDGRPARYPMSEATFGHIRDQLLSSLGDDLVSVDLLEGGTLRIVKRAAASQDRLTRELGELLIKFSFSNPTVIESERG